MLTMINSWMTMPKAEEIGLRYPHISDDAGTVFYHAVILTNMDQMNR